MAGTNLLFVYGTLMSEEVLGALLHRVPKMQPARLEGFHRYNIHGRVYPAIAPRQGGVVEGLLITDLDEDEWDILARDAFEAKEYAKQVHAVEALPVMARAGEDPDVRPGERPQAKAYVWSVEQDLPGPPEEPARDSAKLHGTWSYQSWREGHLKSYSEMCIEFRNGYWIGRSNLPPQVRKANR
eukprot:tig00000655_g2841.t1